MFDAPVDAWYVWLGVAAASVAAAGVAVDLPAGPAPDAAAAAAAVDAVAASGHPAERTRALAAGAVAVGPYRISLRGPGGTATASFAFGPVTPAPPGTRLRRVLAGAAPAAVFQSPDALRRAAAAARERPARFRPTDGTLRIRRVTWEEVDVTLVGA